MSSTTWTFTVFTWCENRKQTQIPASLNEVLILKVSHLDEKLLPVTFHIRSVVWFIIKCCVTLLKDGPQIITGIQAYLNIWQFTLLCTNTFLYCSEMWPWNSFILTYLPRLYLVTLRCERGLFGVSCNPFPFDNASFSIISRLIYCLWGEKLIPTGYAAYCSPFLRVSSGSFWISSWRIGREAL